MSDISKITNEMMAWRHELHAHPEFGFEETKTAEFVAKKLKEFGFKDVVSGIGGTGVIASLKRGSSDRAIALRADMDALRITEQSSCEYRSTNVGKMHGCGHDGHTAMLLGAAKMLAMCEDFNGTIRFIFQPAEEWGKGALAMISDGLMEKFPFDEIYGLHNMPGYPAGEFRTRVGAVMSAEDNFEIVLTGVGGHASRPHSGRETMVAGASLVMNLQTIVSRRIDPTQTTVCSVTEFITDGTRNVLPGVVTISGDVRSFNSDVSMKVEQEMRRITEGIAQAYNVSAEVEYTREFVPLINEEKCTEAAILTARKIYGDARVTVANEPITASEDFAQFLTKVPGCFAFIGNGTESLPLHNSKYDFNDAILIDGARFFVEIAKSRLAA